MSKTPWAEMSEHARDGVRRRATRWAKTESGRANSAKRQATYRERHPEKIAAALSTPQGQIIRRRANQRHLAKRRGHTACLDFPPPPLDGRCQCCGTAATLHLDHDHETGHFRGYLCHHCNTGIGLFGNSIERMKLGIVYLDDGPPYSDINGTLGFGA